MKFLTLVLCSSRSLSPGVVIALILGIMVLMPTLAGCGSSGRPTHTPEIAVPQEGSLHTDEENELTATSVSAVAGLQATEGVTYATGEPVAAVMPTPSPTPTLSPSPTPTPVSFDLSNSTVNLQSSDQPPPSFVKQQLAFGSGGAMDPGTGSGPSEAISAALPTIVESGTNLHQRTYRPIVPAAPDITACGYIDGEVLVVDLLNPAGQVQHSFEVVATYSASTHGTTSAACAQIDQISQYELVPTDPLGQYIVRIGGTASSLEHPFELKSPEFPIFYYSRRLDGYVVAGMRPHEQALVLVYVPTGQGVEPEWVTIYMEDGSESEVLAYEGELGVLAYWGQFNVDENGMALIAYPFDSEEELQEAVYLISSDGDNMLLEDRGHGVRVPYWPPPLDYDLLIASAPNNAIWYFLRAQVHVRYADYAAVMTDLTRAIELDPTQPGYYMERSSWQKDKELAISDITKAIELRPEATRYYRERAWLFSGLGRDNQAVDDLTTAIALDPVDERAYWQRGDIYRQQRDFDKAIADYTRLIDLSNDGLAFQARGEIHLELQNFAQAITDFTAAIDLAFGQDKASRLYARAKAYEASGDVALAIADYEQVVDLDPWDWFGAQLALDRLRQ